MFDIYLRLLLKWHHSRSPTRTNNSTYKQNKPEPSDGLKNNCRNLQEFQSSSKNFHTDRDNKKKSWPITKCLWVWPRYLMSFWWKIWENKSDGRWCFISNIWVPSSSCHYSTFSEKDKVTPRFKTQHWWWESSTI